jgi:glycerate 2-kinase
VLVRRSRRQTGTVTDDLLADALAISSHWLDELDVRSLCEAKLIELNLLGASVDVVAIGKASREMAAAVADLLGERVKRRLIVGDETGGDGDVLVGEHPIPGAGSLRAGEALLTFLGGDSDAGVTLFLISGGASSLCVLPVAPVTLDDLGTLFKAAVTSGANITTLNQLRASTSVIAGGGVLRYVRTPRSASLILVDNVVSGARWVASALTYEFKPSRTEVSSLVGDVGLASTPVGERLLEGSQRRVGLLMGTTNVRHENTVLAEPSLVLRDAIEEAGRRGYRVLDLGSSVHGDVRELTAAWRATVGEAATSRQRTAVLGVGEATVVVRGEGRGGRCQEFAWQMADALADLDTSALFLARATDGRDFIDGVGGAWVDETTVSKARALGIAWESVANSNDSNTALTALGQIIEGGHTGWNLCDLYLVLV